MKIDDFLYEQIKYPFNDDFEKREKTYEKDLEEIFDSIKNSITIKDVLKRFTPEELINAIGIEKTENIIRVHKLKKISNNLKNRSHGR
jgi:hypothetical protein